MTRALITGATSGIGLAFAEAFASDRHDLVLVSRTAADLEETAAALRSRYAVNVAVLPADLADRDDMQKVADRLADARAPVDILVNSAGFGLKQGFLAGELADAEAQDAVLHRAVMVLSHSAALAMRSRGRGAIFTVTSMAAYATMGVYSAAKSAATVFTESLATELRGSGVIATAVVAGFVRTDFHRRARMRMDRLPGWMWLEADQVAEQAIADARKGRIVSIAGPQYRLLALLARIVPRAAVRRVSAGIQRR